MSRVVPCRSVTAATWARQRDAALQLGHRPRWRDVRRGARQGACWSWGRRQWHLSDQGHGLPSRLRVLTGCDDETHTAPEFRLTVSNDLVKPAMPVARSENGTIFVEFHRNPEPDAVTMLQERVNGGGWADKGTDTHFQRPGDPGVYEYRAVATRPHSSQVGSDVTPAFEVTAPPPGAAPGDPGTVAPAPGETPTTATPGTTGTTRPKSGTSSRPRGTEQSVASVGPLCSAGRRFARRLPVPPSPPSTTASRRRSPTRRSRPR